MSKLMLYPPDYNTKSHQMNKVHLSSTTPEKRKKNLKAKHNSKR
jgi:hypothetical protein